MPISKSSLSLSDEIDRIYTLAAVEFTLNQKYGYDNWGHLLSQLDESHSAANRLICKMYSDSIKCLWAHKTVWHSKLDIMVVEEFIAQVHCAIKWTQENEESIVFKMLPIISQHVTRTLDKLTEIIDSKIQYDYTKPNEQ